jgi:sugar/nucleoside kinase (ribokinase family)
MTTNSKYDVITFGSGTRDIFVRSSAFEVQESIQPDHHLEACFPLGAKIEVSEMVFETGGGGTNAAATFAGLGWKTGVVCAIGHDAVGHEIKLSLKSLGIDTGLLQESKRLPTGVSVILLSGGGERTVMVRRGAAASFSERVIPWDKLKAKWFYVASLGGDLKLVKKLLATAHKVGAKVAWNPGTTELKAGLPVLAPLIRQVNLFNVNKEEAAMLSDASDGDLKRIAEPLRELPKTALIITDGQRGSYAFTKNTCWHAGIIDVPRINVTGAGDAFGSGLVAGLLKKDDLRFALATGTWNATGCVQLTGAKVGLLTKYPGAKRISEVPISEA